MLSFHSNRVIIGGLLLGLVLLTGCRSTQGPVAQSRQPTVIPPFMGSQVNSSPFNHSQHITESLPLAVPPAPINELPPSVPAVQVAQNEPSKLPTAQQPILSTPPGDATPDSLEANSGWTSKNCLPTESEWKQTFEEHNRAMLSRLSAVENELSAARNEMLTVNTELKASQAKIGELNQNLTHWQGETRRLETEMKTQQQSDLKSLDELATAVNLLIQQQRNARASNEETVR